MTSARHIVVAGGGPSGILSAILLARQGHDVTVLSGGRRRPRIEGLGQRVVDLLQAHGLAESAAAIGPPVRRHAVWNGASDDRNLEYVTERETFDRALLRDAAAAGIAIRSVKRIARAADRRGTIVRYVTVDGDAVEQPADFFVEARGRSAARRHGGSIEGPPTTALVRALQGDAASQPGTLVESFDDGWAWFVSDGASAYLQIFVDSAAGLPKRPRLTAAFDDLAGRLDAARDVLTASRLAGPVMTRNATPYRAGTLVDGAMIRVGDAAATIDPLSGHGVFHAFGSALAAGPVVNTLLTKPENAALAKRFYDDRARLGFLQAARTGRDFFALEARWRDRPFWRARAAWPDDAPSHRPPGAEPPRIERRPVVADGCVVEARVVVTADVPRGIWQVDGVRLAELIDLLGQRTGRRLPDCAPDMERCLGVDNGQLDTALSWMRSRGLLGNGDRIEVGSICGYRKHKLPEP